MYNWKLIGHTSDSVSVCPYPISFHFWSRLFKQLTVWCDHVLWEGLLRSSALAILSVQILMPTIQTETWNSLTLIIDVATNLIFV